MRKLILLSVIMFIAIYSFSQIITYNEVITKKKKGKFNTYIAENGKSYSLFDTLEIGVPFNNDNYDYILQNAGIAMYPLTAMASGSMVVIKKIKTFGKMLAIYTSTPNGYVYNLYVGNFEGALENGELKDPDFLTQAQALKMLKMEKDKLDLDLITQEEYDKRKAKLAKFIK
jgi:hypothetical protein